MPLKFSASNILHLHALAGMYTFIFEFASTFKRTMSFSIVCCCKQSATVNRKNSFLNYFVALYEDAIRKLISMNSLTVNDWYSVYYFRMDLILRKWTVQRKRSFIVFCNTKISQLNFCWKCTNHSEMMGRKNNEQRRVSTFGKAIYKTLP